MRNLKQVLRARDGITSAQANLLIEEARMDINDYLAEGDLTSAEEICSEHFGLEDDYLLDLI